MTAHITRSRYEVNSSNWIAERNEIRAQLRELGWTYLPPRVPGEMLLSRTIDELTYELMLDVDDAIFFRSAHSAFPGHHIAPTVNLIENLLRSGY